jgi:hypothetical protein
MGDPYAGARRHVLKRYAEVGSWRKLASEHYPGATFGAVRDFALGRIVKPGPELKRILGISRSKPKPRVREGVRYGDQPGRLGDRL